LRRGQNPLLIHSSVVQRINASEIITIKTEPAAKKYRPINLIESIPEAASLELSDDFVELTLPNTWGI
jgi:hypothetical protein